MIKQKGYYGFFLVSKNGISICAGGVPKKISPFNDITKFYDSFICMVNSYLEALAPYRRIQNCIAEKIKKIGGYGRIHGFIVDIDDYNHIMLNPSNGEISYYFSPRYGVVMEYNNLLELLYSQCPELADNYQREFSVENQALISVNNPILKKLNIKESIYPFSNKMQQLQRLFDKHILRDWNDELLAINLDKQSKLRKSKQQEERKCRLI